MTRLLRGIQNHALTHLCVKRERTVCAKWQWNARVCVTGLHDRRSRECNPVTPVECVSLSFRTHPCVLAFITCIFCTYTRNWDGFWLMNLTQKVTRSYIFFKFAICSIALLSLGETRHLKGRDMVECESTRQHYDVTRFKYVLWRRTMHEWVMNTHYQTWIAQGRLINMIRTLSKQWGVCDNGFKTLHAT